MKSLLVLILAISTAAFGYQWNEQRTQIIALEDRVDLLEVERQKLQRQVEAGERQIANLEQQIRTLTKAGNASTPRGTAGPSNRTGYNNQNSGNSGTSRVGVNRTNVEMETRNERLKSQFR